MTNRPAPLLQLRVRRVGRRAVLHLDGELDCSTAPQLTATLRDLLHGQDPPDQLLVDAAGLRFADVTGLDPLVRVAQRLGAGKVRLRRPGRQVLRVVEVLRLDTLLGVDP